MKAERYLDEETTIKKGVDVLVRELGPVEAMRFLSLPRERRQESVKRHREWQKTLGKKDFFDEVFEVSGSNLTSFGEKV
jgi:hypothetical protein